jgi:hypothetical protein
MLPHTATTASPPNRHHQNSPPAELVHGALPQLMQGLLRSHPCSARAGRCLQTPAATSNSTSRMLARRDPVPSELLPGFLERIAECNAGLEELPTLTPLYVAGRQAGRVKPAFLEHLRRHPAVFTVEAAAAGPSGRVSLAPELDTPEKRTAKVAGERGQSSAKRLNPRRDRLVSRLCPCQRLVTQLLTQSWMRRVIFCKFAVPVPQRRFLRCCRGAGGAARSGRDHRLERRAVSCGRHRALGVAGVGGAG